VDVYSVALATAMLKEIGPDVLIHNAGAYSIPRCTSNSGYDNVYTINFASPYYMVRELLPTLREKQGKVVVVGSIAHNYSKIDPSDIDFSTRKKASLVYGNAKRYLTYALYDLMESENEIAITHPGITFTNITSHYPKLIFAVIKYPMKVIFMSPRRASLSVLSGIFWQCGKCEWIGPRHFRIWGMPRCKKLTTADKEERTHICSVAEQIYQQIL
jgi:NAD(P)-dependent dehydrogenase (short-subunit alcohol dehydrogenase family)